MIRGDGRASYWKERFMFGLPNALTEKVQGTLRERFQGTIPYDTLTYGDLISEIKKTGLKLCFQIKLQHKLKKDLKTSRKDLGSFCNQYGISMPVPPSHKNKMFHPKRKSPYSKTYPKKHYKKYKNYNKYKTQHHKNPTKKVINCFICG